MTVSRIRTAVVLAAGAGTKFWPYNVVRQKVTFPIANVPVIRRLADDLETMGVNRIIVVVGHGESSVRAALRGCRAEVRYVCQGGASGTAAAALEGANGLNEDFLVVAGDVVTDAANLSVLKSRFEEDRPLAAALIQPLDGEPARNWLVAHAEDGLLQGVVGHGRVGQHRLCGAYVMAKSAIPYLRDNPGVMMSVPVGGMPPVEAEIAQSLQMMVDEKRDVLAVETCGHFVDLDKPWHILEANHRMIDAMSRAKSENVIPDTSRIHDGAEIHGRVVLGKDCTIGNRVVVRGDLWMEDGASVENGAILDGPVVIGRDTVVKDYCQIGSHTTVGARGIYGHGAEFSGVALGTVHCYHYCEIWGVVGEAVDFGAATVCGNLRFDDGETEWRIKGRAERPTIASNAAYFGDYCRTGVNAIIMPGRRIGVYSCVGAGVVVYDDVPNQQLLLLKQEVTTRSWGPEQYGW